MQPCLDLQELGSGGDPTMCSSAADEVDVLALEKVGLASAVSLRPDCSYLCQKPSCSIHHTSRQESAVLNRIDALPQNLQYLIVKFLSMESCRSINESEKAPILRFSLEAASDRPSSFHLELDTHNVEARRLHSLSKSHFQTSDIDHALFSCGCAGFDVSPPVKSNRYSARLGFTIKLLSEALPSRHEDQAATTATKAGRT
ncbi:hypothetical protein B0T13DRAFT_281152 [Neurospora crassa]|nr:hypothetical protein B0T13DRAFT_281152 [Neurospora crassa]